MHLWGLGLVSVVPADAAASVALVIYVAPSAWPRKVRVHWSLRQGLRPALLARTYRIKAHVSVEKERHLPVPLDSKTFLKLV